MPSRGLFCPKFVRMWSQHSGSLPHLHLVPVHSPSMVNLKYVQKESYAHWSCEILQAHPYA